MAKRSFRSPEAQAIHAVKQLTAHGCSRHEHKQNNPGLIFSLSTDRKTREILSQYATWRESERLGPLTTSRREEAILWLESKADKLQQKSLEGYRQALDKLHLHRDRGGEKLPHMLAGKDTRLGTRAYTREQIQLIAAAQTDRNSLSTLIAHACGLRAHELLTLLPVAEQPASSHRIWNDARFDGRPGAVTHTVVGKGGLCREVAPLPPELLARLEARRLPEPRIVLDRGILYEQHYDIGGGSRFSASIAAASQRVLGWSNGAHGLRHSYVHERLQDLTGIGYSAKDADKILSQEIGHFRSLVSVYRR